MNWGLEIPSKTIVIYNSKGDITALTGNSAILRRRIAEMITSTFEFPVEDRDKFFPDYRMNVAECDEQTAWRITDGEKWMAIRYQKVRAAYDEFHDREELYEEEREYIGELENAIRLVMHYPVYYERH